MDKSSISVKRTQLISKLIAVAETYLAKGFSPLTVRQRLWSFSQFADWTDSCFSEDLITEERTADAIKAYFAYLNGRVDYKNLGASTAGSYQADILGFCARLFPRQELHVNQELQSQSDKFSAGTLPPSETLQGRQLSLSYALFEGFSAIALDFPSFPVSIPTPAYLNEPGNILWIFPVAPYFATTAERENHSTKKRFQRVMDFETGAMRPLSELQTAYASIEGAQKAFMSANDRLRLANKHRRHHSRLSLGLLAGKAFLDVFCANTGMNWSDAVRLPWTGEYSIDAVRQQFRTIKYRAGGKEIEYDIEAVFLPHLKRYLKLREYLLQDVEWPYMFFQGEVQAFHHIKPRLYPYNSTTLHRKQTRLDPTLKPISNKRWRAAATNYHVDRYGPETAAIRFQNKPATIRRHYAEGTPTQAIRELGIYFDRLEHITFRTSREGAECTESSVGGCEKQDCPKSVVDEPAVPPDCNDPAGCLYCENHYLFADEKDARKLLSFRFVINNTRSFSEDVTHWQKIQGPVIERITKLVDSISRFSNEHKSMVEKVMQEVEVLGKLDDFWRRKLLMLNYLSGDALW